MRHRPVVTPIITHRGAQMTEITGSNFIGGKEIRNGSENFRAKSRFDGTDLPGLFSVATEDEVKAATQNSYQACLPYSQTTSTKRADFLVAIAEEIEKLGDELLERASLESGLGLPRLTGERGRTCGQLRMFADLLREGTWTDERHEPADPSRTPPKPELLRKVVPLGPVAVFGASNFPLAFSVAGGDTASALAAGCSVVVKAHPAHPGTSELTARAVLAAAKRSAVPEGILNLLHGGTAVGQSLVQAEEIYAVGFTGSLIGGRAIFDLAAKRARPIPVYAEMGSINPIFLLPGALANRGEAIGTAYADSLTLGVGQFCTNPGIVVGVGQPGWEEFLSSAVSKLQTVSPGLMLTDGIDHHYREETSAYTTNPNLNVLFAGESKPGAVTPAFFETSAQTFLAHPELKEEVFGPLAIAVRCQNLEEVAEVCDYLEGQLTVSIHAEPADHPVVQKLLPHLIRAAGRIVYNGFPTGVEVNSAQQHGGPYPATTDSRSTSVGTAAIQRFVRPVAFQNFPPDLIKPS
jgi:2,5-dioxopentanoate dehydrogenase